MRAPAPGTLSESPPIAPIDAVDAPPLDRILEDELAAVLEGRGRAVFVVAPPGRAALDRAAAFQEEAFRRHSKLRVAYVDCVHTTPEDDAWEQFERILTRRYRLRGSARRLAGDWLEVIPILGPVLQAGWLTVQTLLRSGDPDEERGGAPVGRRGGPGAGRPSTSPPAAHERGSDLWTLEPLEPRLMVLENFQQAFPSELAGTSGLLRRLGGTRTLFVAVARVEGALPPLVEDLILEAERGGRARRVDLVKARAVAAPAAPDPSGLSEEDTALLARSAVEGPVLHPLFLERLLGLPELELEDRFARLVRAGILEERGIEELDGEPSGAYAFRDPARREALLALLAESERRELQERAAEMGGAASG